MVYYEFCLDVEPAATSYLRHFVYFMLSSLSNVKIEYYPLTG